MAPPHWSAYWAILFERQVSSDTPQLPRKPHLTPTYCRGEINGPPSFTAVMDGQNGGLTKGEVYSYGSFIRRGVHFKVLTLHLLCLLQGDTEEFAKPHVDSDLRCSVILPGQ